VNAAPKAVNGARPASRELTRQGQERKQAILDAAASLFAERGYAETRIIDIVRAAGVAKGLFYWYFENKEAVFAELVGAVRHQLRLEQGRAIDPDATALRRVGQGVEASVRFMGEHRRLYSFFDMESLDPRLMNLLRPGAEVHITDTAAHVRAGIEAGQIQDEDPVLLAHGVVGAVAWFSHLHRTGRIDMPVDELADFTARFVVRALAADDEAAADAQACGGDRAGVRAQRRRAGRAG
jgi:AcrR family transcriptional regulator